MLLAACAGERRTPGSDARARQAAPPLPRPVPPAEPASAPSDSAVWFTEQRTLDFTGDGVPDTVTLRALGRAADSLRITLTFRSGSEERWREEWASEYELVDPPPLADAAARDAFVRQKLERALASVEVEPFDSASYAAMADPVDSAVLRQPPRTQVSLSYGYETTLALAWDATTRKLRLLFGCC